MSKTEKYYIVVGERDTRAARQVPRLIEQAEGDVERFRSLYSNMFGCGPVVIDNGLYEKRKAAGIITGKIFRIC